MSSEPPSSSDAEDEERASESSGRYVDRRSSHEGRARWRSCIIPVVGLLAVAGSVGLFLFRTQGVDQQKEQQEQPALTRGLTCPHLLQAADASGRGDRLAFSREIQEAAKVAEDTLQTSGEEFGEPERIALELELGQIKNPERLLARAEDVCSELARPSSS